ncbi:bifunctional adenosylcobinamide kinase/adenosylcobinamide-phosphate guanylyltransferase [Paracidovorax citrulli]
MSTASDPSLNAGIAPLSEPSAHSSSSAGPNASPQPSPIPGPISYGPRQLTLVLGGARSGKSHYAEQIATDHATITGGPVTYVATALADDDVADEEMQLRIALHRARRPPDWQLVEEPVHLADALYAHARREGCIVVDCVTLWLNNLLFLDNKPYPEHGLITPPPAFTEETDALLAALPTLPGHVVLVSNEIGLGVVPMGSVNRFYVDELGRLNQKLAAVADRVRLLVAGLPVAVKGADPAW